MPIVKNHLRDLCIRENKVKRKHKILKFLCCPNYLFYHLLLYFWSHAKKPLPNSRLQRFTLMFSPNSFIVLALIFTFMICFKLFLYKLWEIDSTLFFYRWVSSCHVFFLKRWEFFLFIIVAPLSVSVDQKLKGLFLDAQTIFWSVCLFLCQSTLFLIIVSL